MATTPNLPNPESYDQLLADMLSSYAASIGVDDSNVGSINTAFFAVVALMVARSSGDLFQVLRDFSLARATGDALQRLAAENGITPLTAQPTTGAVNIIDTSFTQIITKVYAGALPPNIGSIAINVSDASNFPASGSVYIGRSTPNVEGPLPYSSITAIGGYYTINLSSPTTKYHNLGESVILAQGGTRTIPINTIVLSPGTGSNANIQYATTASAVILDGDTEVDGVPVTALVPGSAGNIPIGTVKSFATLPFSGATVTNPLPFTTGQDNETDDQLRVRVQLALASTGLGTATAVLAALIGAQAPDQPDTIVSDSIQINTDGSATVFIDNGSGYEATSIGVGLESIVDSAIGGEQFFALQTGGDQAPVAKAFLQSNLSAPFDLIGGDTLAVNVDEVTYQHVFANTDFRSPGGATAYEVTASINADSALGFEATTAGGGIYVVIRPKLETTNSIQITVPTTSGRNAATLLGFSSNKIDTLRLYKNNVPLSEDGATASVFAQDQNLWSASIGNGDTLILTIDNTAPITFTFLNSDFITTGLYSSVASTNSLASWVQVFNDKLTGITATIVGTQIELTSNLGASDRASIVIDPSSTLVIKGMFGGTQALSSTGVTSDYTLDRNTAQFELVVPLLPGDKLSAGTTQTEATVTTASIASGSVTFASNAHIWILIDSPGTIINTGVTGNTTLTVSQPSANVVRYSSTVAECFDNVLPGDYVIVWSAELPSSDQLEGRVHAVTALTLDILVTAAEYAAATPTTVLFQNGFVVARTNNVPQKFELSAGTLTLDQIAVALQAQTASITFSVLDEQFLVSTTTTLDDTGSLLVVTADAQGQLLDMPIGEFEGSTDSLIAFYDSGDRDAQLPLFIHTTFAADAFADPIDSYITSVTSSVSLAGQDPNDLIGMLQPYGSSNDEQPFNEYVQETSVVGPVIGIVDQPDIRRVRGGVDRFYLASPLNFGHNDTIVVILDNNTENEAFTIPLYRDALVNSTYTSNPSNFNAYDVTSGPTVQFSAFFGPTFSFNNFKVLMQAKKVLKPSPSMTAILYRSVMWGSSGEQISVAYVYPTGPNLPISSNINIVNDQVQLTVGLKSGNSISTSIDSTTNWNVTITPNTPMAGVDQVTYTWSGTGTAPALSLSGGEYVNITTQSTFNVANTGVFRVSTQAGFTPTPTSFTVQRPTGVAVAQSNASTNVNGAVSFYAASPTTAAQVVAYFAALANPTVSATLVNDGGMSGAGVIVLSTYEDSGYTYTSQSLQDGINWILSSELLTSPQFTLKKPLTLPTDVGYAFNNGEDIRFVPTTMDQVRRFISVLAVSGFTTLGQVNVADRGTRLELSTNILGSLGAVQIVGGSGNEYQVPVLQSAIRLDNTYMSVPANAVAAAPMESDQWFRLQATIAQKKITDFSSNTSVTLIPNSPIAGQTTVQLFGRTPDQRYFGATRSGINTRGDTFRVESQGSLVCVSWNGVGTNPNFYGPLSFNDVSGGTFNVALVSGTSDVQYTILTGNANFTAVSIGDLITITGMPNAANNGTFLVTGVSAQTVQVTNPNGQNEFSNGTFTFTTNASGGDTFTVGVTVLTVGTYAFFTGTIAGTSTPVTITANNLGTVGNSVSLTFNGSTTITSQIAAWNAANPANMITLTAGNGIQTPTAFTTVNLSGGINGNFALGATASITAANLATAISLLPQVTAVAVGNVVTVTGTFVGQVLALAYTGVAVTVSGPFIVGPSFVAGNFSVTSGVQEGDTVIMTAPFNVLNQGRFRVIRQYNNSFYIENPDMVPEEVLLPYNPVNLAFDATTSFAVTATNHLMYLTWNGTGTEPLLGNAVMGDVITFGTDFAAANQGSFTVLSAGVKLNQITQFVLPTGAQFTLSGPGTYFYLNNTSNVNEYYVWFNVNGTNTDPGPIVGRTGVMVAILSGDSAAIVAAKTASAINGSTVGITASSVGNILTTSLAGFAVTTDPVNVNVPAPFSVNVIQEGRTTYLEVTNPSVVTQASVLVTGGVLQDHRPQMEFTAYDGTVPGDDFVITGSVLTAANAGTYPVIQVLDPNTAVINGTLGAVSNVSLNGNETAVYVLEGLPYIYTGYKHVYLVSPQPGAPLQSIILFDTNAQYEKVDQAAGVQMVSLGKLNFNTALKNGLDGYRYNTGLIGEANRIVYGDTRNPSTYPGVGAAGADIFIREPLALRVQVSLDIRLQTGAPFANVSQQVQTAVASLIQSNPVGQSISISSILSAAQAVPGVISVAIDSPLFNSTHDLIALQPSQKAIIIDPSQDILVSAIS
jgi:uncharacterized phage protein gp47/JayE